VPSSPKRPLLDPRARVIIATPESLGYEREQIDKFLRADGGKLPHPTTIAVLTDTGTQIYPGFSTDGNVLSASLDQYTVSLRTLRREDLFGAAGLFQLSLENLHELAAREAPGPGRKVILWVSPGWPLLSGPNVELDASEQQKLFGNIVDFSTQFLRARITLYSIDPLVLLCHKRRVQQNGQQGSRWSRDLASLIRSVAIEHRLCRSARMRRAAGLEVGWNVLGA
jgi:hypothetical protein